MLSSIFLFETFAYKRVIEGEMGKGSYTVEIFPGIIFINDFWDYLNYLLRNTIFSSRPQSLGTATAKK